MASEGDRQGRKSPEIIITKAGLLSGVRGEAAADHRAQHRRDRLSSIDKEIIREDIRRSERIKHLSKVYTTHINLAAFREQTLSTTVTFSLSQIHLPKSYENAMRSPQVDKWQETINAELEGL